MTTPELNINDSLLHSHQGAILGALGGFGDRIKGFLTEPAQSLSTVVSRLGVGTAAMAIIAMSALAAPGQAQAQTQWVQSNWQAGVSSSINDAFQQQRQMDLANQGARVIGDARGLNYKEQNIVNLLGQVPGAFTSGSKAAGLTGLVAIGAAAVLPATGTSDRTILNGTQQNGQQIVYTGNQGQGNSQWTSASPWNTGNGGSYQQQGNNAQSAATQQAYNAYVQYSEPQYQVALRANMEGNMQARRDAIISFGNAWNAASQTGLPLSKIPQEVAKFQQMQSMDGQALHAGLQGQRVAAQVTYGQGYQR